MYDLAHADSRAMFDGLRYDLDRDVQKWTALVSIPVFGLVFGALFVPGLLPGHDDPSLDRAYASLMWLTCLGLYFVIRRALLLLWRDRLPTRLTLKIDDITTLERTVENVRAVG